MRFCPSERSGLEASIRVTTQGNVGSVPQKGLSPREATTVLPWSVTRPWEKRSEANGTGSPPRAEGSARCSARGVRGAWGVTPARALGKEHHYLSFFSLPEVKWLLTNPKEVPLNIKDTPTAPLFPKWGGEGGGQSSRVGKLVRWQEIKARQAINRRGSGGRGRRRRGFIRGGRRDGGGEEEAGALRDSKKAGGGGGARPAALGESAGPREGGRRLPVNPRWRLPTRSDRPPTRRAGRAARRSQDSAG